jgi:hypothetical protein
VGDPNDLRARFEPRLPLPADFEPPTGLDHERFRLRMLSIADVDAD